LETTVQKMIEMSSVFEIIENESYSQNEGKIDPNIGYAISKNKRLFFQSITKNKKFVENLEQFNKFVVKKQKVEKQIKELEGKNSNLKNKKEIESNNILISEKKNQIEKLENENKNVIETNTKGLTKKETIDGDLYKFNLKNLPKLKQSVIDYLIDNNLINSKY